MTRLTNTSTLLSPCPVPSLVEHNSTRTSDEIWALSQSAHVTACSALPIALRVQSSGRAEPAFPGGSERVHRAQAILGRLYADGGVHRKFAIALFWTFGHVLDRGDDHDLALALALLLSASQRADVVRGWAMWGRGSNATILRQRGADLLADAVQAYESHGADVGVSAGVLVQVLEDTDAARSVVRQLRADAGSLRGSMRPLEMRCSGTRAVGSCHFGYGTLRCAETPAHDAKRCAVRFSKQAKGCE